MIIFYQGYFFAKKILISLMEIKELYQLFKKHPFISTDTRKIKKGSIFFALKGDNFDGNKFAKQAIENGAKYAVISDKNYLSDNCILVSDTLDVLQKLAKYHRLQLNIPILNGFATKGNIQRNKINLERSKFQLEQAELDLESTVYQAYVDAKGALKSYEAAKSAVESQQLAYDYAKERYDVGLTNAFDFSQSKLRFDNANIELNRAKYDYIFKLKVLELYFGIPATELKF